MAGSRIAGRRSLAVAMLIGLVLGRSAAPTAHEIENTHVLVSFMPDGTYQVDILNDADWMWMQLHPDAGELPAVARRDGQLATLAPTFTRGVTVMFDGRRVTPATIAYRPPRTRDRSTPMGLAEPGVLRLAGPVPPAATTFRFGYDRVVDDYPITLAAAAGDPVTRWLPAGRLSEAFELAALRPLTRWQVAVQYLHLGFTHILPKGLDHILFVLGLFLLSPKITPLLLQVTAFTVAHTLTLALTIYGVFTLAPAVVEPLIALSIAYVAVENLVTTELHPWRVALVFAFGLLHGMGFAGVLGDLGLPRSEFITALLTFNVGVELGQLTVIGAAFGAVVGFRGRVWYRPRVVAPASLAIAAVGLYWTVERAWLG